MHETPTPATQEIAGIPSDHLKAIVLNKVYEMDCLQVLSGFKLLTAKHLKTNTGIFVVDGNYGREHFKLAIEEAKQAGLNIRRQYVYAETGTYSGNGICLSKLHDIGIDTRLILAEAAKTPMNVLGQSAPPPYYIWADEDCGNKSDSWAEAKAIRLELVNDGSEDVHIVDADGVEVVDAEIEGQTPRPRQD